jgi:hypothetical protein
MLRELRVIKKMLQNLELCKVLGDVLSITESMIA